MTEIRFKKTFDYAHGGIDVVKYEPGHTADIPEHHAKIIVAAGHAELVSPPIDEEAADEAAEESLVEEEITVEDEDAETEEVIDETIPEQERTKDSPTVKTRKGGKK